MKLSSLYAFAFFSIVCSNAFFCFAAQEPPLNNAIPADIAELTDEECFERIRQMITIDQADLPELPQAPAADGAEADYDGVLHVLNAADADLKDSARHALGFFQFFDQLIDGAVGQLNAQNNDQPQLVGRLVPPLAQGVKKYFRAFVYQPLIQEHQERVEFAQNAPAGAVRQELRYRRKIPQCLLASLQVILANLGANAREENFSQKRDMLLRVWGIVGREYTADKWGTLRGTIEAFFDRQRRNDLGPAMAWLLNTADAMIGRANFPIKNHAQLGAEFTQAEWSHACYTSQSNIIQIFLDEEGFDHLLTLYDGDNQPLSWAAFGYLNADAEEGDNVTTQGFELLLNDPRVTTAFPISYNHGRVAFDEWLLQDASYPDDGIKQGRLEHLKRLVAVQLSDERKAYLDQQKLIKDRLKEEREERIAQIRSARHKKYWTVAGFALTVGGLYWWYKKSTKHEMKPDARSVAQIG